MEKVNSPCIASIYMNNISSEVVDAQKKVVSQFNPSGVPHYSVLTQKNPGDTLDALIKILFEDKKHDAIMFLDIDCVPLNSDAIDYMFDSAYGGTLIGDAQRSNHIENGQHVFVAPHNITFTEHLYDTLGRPSFAPTHRGDVAEELTFIAEERKVNVEILLPVRYDAPPIRMHWETDTTPYWALADGMSPYGIGTTFATAGGYEMFWHNYQIFHNGQQERFLAKCKELLNS